MAAIGSPSPISANEINNFTGELFKVTPQRTPLLSATGGLTGGKVINSIQDLQDTNMSIFGTCKKVIINKLNTLFIN